MNGTTLLAAQRAPALINRQRELEIIRRAIYRPDAELQIVLIRGAGGMGKSRLAEEVLWHAGNWRARQNRRENVSPEQDWTKDGSAIVGDVIDLNDVTLHSRAAFMHAVRNALIWEGNGIRFPKYDAAYGEFQRLRAMQGEYVFLKELEKHAEESFFNDYRQNAQRQRLVLVLDTVEKLYPIGGTRLLLEAGLLKPEDIDFYTYQWLLQQIEQNNLPNTTLLLVGRDEEGKAFFEEIGRAAKKNKHCRITPLNIGPFSLKDTRTYFQILANEWEQRAQADAQVENIARTIAGIARDKKRAEIIWIYTGGQPVRLALYTDLIIEDWTIPTPFQKTLEEARQAQASPEELEQARKEIEAGFIRLLFAGTHLRSTILQALVRAPRGLDVDQIHYILTAKPGETVKEWSKRLEKGSNGSAITRAQIEEELTVLSRLALVKIRPDGRLGLQDEVYRIYARALAGDERQHQPETEARQKLYSQLAAWAEHKKEQFLEEVISYQAQDESRLSLGRPSEALNVSFPPLSVRDQQRRDQARAQLQHWVWESLHYAVLSDFSHNFNHILFEIADAERMANDENAFAILQAERWQLLYDPAYALPMFGKIEPWLSLQRRGEPPLQAFKRVALQDDVTNWIKLFTLRKQYGRAVEFAQALEEKIEEWTRTRQEDPNFLALSWQHTLARHERALWKNYACVMIGQNVLPVLEEMKVAVGELERLLEHSQEETVFPDRGMGETGFRGHPAESKTQRLVALYYNYMGYGYANLGLTRSAQEAYGKSLRAMRKVEFRHMEATVRNNLSRVLSERGYMRGRRLCLDALALRKQLAAEVPIAYSYNTLALIDNDHLRPDLAWIEAAIALAYFNKANEPRGQGLALLQLGEALRRLVKRSDEPYHLRGDSPDVVLQTADQALTRAIEIFTHSPASKERIRLVEAWVEKGCLERDWIRFVERENFAERERHYRDAVYYLEQAIELAKELGNKRLELDARVNIAWTHYHFGDFQRAREALQAAMQQIPPDALLQPGKAPPTAERDDIYLYQQLSKMEGLRGRLALEEFRQIAEDFRKSFPDREERRRHIREDKNAQRLLEEGAKAYVQALNYAQLHSPRSIALTVTYDAIYEYLKGFNLTELEVFYDFAQKAINEYRLTEIIPLDMSRLDSFLQQTFGLGK